MLNESALEKVERKWKDILENGKRFRGISENVNPEKPPLWFDEAKFLRSQQLAHKYYTSLLFGQFLGLILVLYHADGLAPLLVTGNSSNVPKLFRRYLSTILHVKYWYEFNPFDPKSKSFKSLRQVRGMHKQVSRTMNQKSNRTEGTDNLWIPQYGMAHAQFAFIGFVALYPKQCGLHSLTDEEFDCLLYFWRVIGYCLGTDDRFNLCSGSSEETVELCKLIFWREWYPLIIAETPSAPVGVEMGKGICLAMNSVTKSIHWNVLMKYWFPILNIPKTVTLQSFSEYFWYYFLKFHMNYTSKLSLFHWLSSSSTRLNIAIASRLKEWKEKRLAKKFKSLSYDNNSCPFDVNFNYVDVFNIKESKNEQLLKE